MIERVPWRFHDNFHSGSHRTLAIPHGYCPPQAAPLIISAGYPCAGGRPDRVAGRVYQDR